MATEELILLERVFLRLGSAESDEQLQNVLGKFLPPVLLKLASTEEQVRKKVMELLIHINKRIKSRPQVQLPVDALLAQYQDPSASSFVTNFTIIYIKSGFPRLSIEKQTELVPIMLNALENKPETHLNSLLLIITPLLGKVKVPTDPAKVSSLFGLKEKPQISKHLLELLLDILLLPYGSVTPVSNDQQSGNVTMPVPPGMSENSFKRITLNNPMKPEELEEIKLGVVKFLSHEIFPIERFLIHLIVAAADTRFSVANLADTELKKIIGSVDWSSASVATVLFQTFLGSQVKNLKNEDKKSPVCTRIRLKLLIYLCKVIGKGLIFPASMQVIFDSLYGNNTNTRLKNLALNFTGNVIRYADDAALDKFAPVLLSGLKKLIETDEETHHQGQAYILIGLFAQRFWKIVYHDVQLLETYFKNLELSNVDLKLQIREGLLNLLPAYRYDLDIDNIDKDGRLNILFALCKYRINSQESIVRFVVVRTLATIFPPKHVPSKYLILTCIGDNKDEVSVEAVKSLYGAAKKSESTQTQFPDFAEIVRYIATEAEILIKDANKNFTIGTHTLPFKIQTFQEILFYLRLCLLQDVEMQICKDTAMVHPCESTPIIADYLKQVYLKFANQEQHPLVLYTRLIHQLLIANSSVESLNYLVEMIGCLPQIYKFNTNELHWIREQLNSTREDIREQSSILYALLLQNLEIKDYESAIKSLITIIEENKPLEAQHGAILAIGTCLETKLITNPPKFLLHQWDLLKTCINTITKMLKHPNPLLISGSCCSLGLIARCCPLPLPDGQQKNGSPDVKRIASDVVTKIDIFNDLNNIMNNTKLTMRIRERAVKTLGLLCVGEKFPYTKDVIQAFLNTAKDTKDVEMHFTIGEALVMCCQSIWSPEARNFWTTLPNDYQPPQQPTDNQCDANLNCVIDELLKLSKQTHPNSKQASSIWLLAILNSCVNKKESIHNRLQAIQNAFMDLLCENNDVVQDVASKGLCVIYDISKSPELLSALVKQLTSGTRQVIKVSDDTKLFEEGQLGQAPTGGNLSTYKELCSLASDLNKPDLIYQFLNLAKHNTIWNSKKGAAFGFSSIAEKCGEDLKVHLPLIIPKLYRYQFDPTPNIQASMHNIWRVLVTEPQKTLDEYFDEILSDLLANLNANQYRVRQSCCLALQDFLKGSGNRTIYDCIDKMDELWMKLFRVMDDHHEATRATAVRTSAVLTKLCIRACDAEQGKNAMQMVEALLPPFLNHGITSTVVEVRIISLQTVSELVGTAGKQLKPFMPKLIPALLMSQIPLNEILSKCIQYTDCSMLEMSKIYDLLKGSNGPASRIATSNFLNLLTIQTGNNLEPYTGKLLSILMNGLTDRNSNVRKHFASTIGHLVSQAKDTSLEKLFKKLEQFYFEREDDTIRSACALTIQSIGIHNQEILKKYSKDILPLVFFAMHSEKSPDTENTLNVWCEIWSEHSPGTELGIRQNFDEIIKIIQTALESPSWTMKAQGASCVTTIANKLGNTMEVAHRNRIIDMLINGLSGRIWTGKEKLSKALASICTNCKESLKDDKEIDLNALIDAMLKECKKSDIRYKTNSLQAFGEILSSLSIDKFDEVYEIIQTILINDSNQDSSIKDDLSTEESQKYNEDTIKLKEIAYETLGKIWPANSEITQQKYQEMFVKHCVNVLPTITRSIQVSVVTALYNYIDKLILLKQEQQLNDDVERNNFDVIINDLLIAMKYSLEISKHTRLRKEALNCLICLGQKLKNTNRMGEFDRLKGMFDELLPELMKDTQPEIKSRISDLKRLLYNTE